MRDCSLHMTRKERFPDMNLSTGPLPTFFSVRGWSAELNPAYITFVDELRASGQTVEDVFVSHAGCRTFGEWAARATAEILARRDPEEPLHLIGYCGGGSLLHLVAGELERRGVAIDHLVFIDVRAGNPKERLARGYDSLYEVPWGLRARFQLPRLASPENEPLASVLASVGRRAVRSTLEIRERGWRSRNRQAPAVYAQARLAAHWCSTPITTFAFLYNCPKSIDRYWPGDPSLGRAPLLRGGFTIRLIDGTHENCIAPPHSASLIELVTRDRLTSAAELQTPRPGRRSGL